MPVKYFQDRKNPTRDKILLLAFGFGLDLTDTQRLLKISGANELYPRNVRDSAIIFAINKGLNIRECDDLLYELDKSTLLEK